MDVIEKFLVLIAAMFSLATSIALYRTEKLKQKRKRKIRRRRRRRRNRHKPKRD